MTNCTTCTIKNITFIYVILYILITSKKYKNDVILSSTGVKVQLFACNEKG